MFFCTGAESHLNVLNAQPRSIEAELDLLIIKFVTESGNGRLPVKGVLMTMLSTLIYLKRFSVLPSLYRRQAGGRNRHCLQGYLAHEKMPTPLRPPKDPRHRPTVGS